MLTTPNQFKDKVLRAMYYELSRKLGSAAFRNDVRRESRAILEEELRAQDAYQSMVAEDGRLRRELGVADNVSAMESLVRDWSQSTIVTVGRPRILGSRLVGTIVQVKSVQADYQDVLEKAYASYVTERGDEIPWLNWLLTRGVDLLVFDHVVWRPPVPTAASRTGTNTIMKKSKGGAWGVPERFAGVADNNFCTKAIEKALPRIGQVIEQQVRRRV
jgi:hypothetical protein